MMNQAAPFKHAHYGLSKKGENEQPTIYLIRHGEKPPKIDGKDQDGLSTAGFERAQGLRKVFGAESAYHIGFIMAQHPKEDGGEDRPYETIKPLAADLGLKANTKIKRDNEAGAAAAALAFAGPGNVLACWEHGCLAGIVAAIGVEGYADGVDERLKFYGADGKIAYPDDRFDLIWAVPPPYNRIVSVVSEGIAGLDT